MNRERKGKSGKSRRETPQGNEVAPNSNGTQGGPKRGPERDANGKFKKKTAPSDGDGKSVEECVRVATEQVCRDLPEIVTGIADKAKKGSYLHAKFLCELARVGEMTLEVGESGEREPSAAEELLQKLNEMRAEQAAKQQVE